MNQRKTSERIRPVLFNTEMVKALLEGRKTVTRRVVKLQPAGRPAQIGEGSCWPGYFANAEEKRVYRPPYQPGDILWVRESWQFIPCIDCRLYVHGGCTDTPITYEDKDSIGEGCFIYRADYPEPQRVYWKPSIHMPRDAARIFLRVKGVGVERLQDIDDAGVTAEGLEIGCYFDELWDSTIKPKDRAAYGWGANPWVWVIQFEHCEKPSWFEENRG